MLCRLKVRKANFVNVYSLSFGLSLSILFKMISASFHRAIESPLRHQVLHEPVEIRVASVSALDRARSFLFRPHVDAIAAESSLTLRALFRIREDFEANDACEVVILVCGQLALGGAGELRGVDQASGRQLRRTINILHFL